MKQSQQSSNLFELPSNLKDWSFGTTQSHHILGDLQYDLFKIQRTIIDLENQKSKSPPHQREEIHNKINEARISEAFRAGTIVRVKTQIKNEEHKQIAIENQQLSQYKPMSLQQLLSAATTAVTKSPRVRGVCRLCL